jgi:cyclic beta-1,2-glucan synthetase
MEGGNLPAVVRLQHWIAEEALSAEAAAVRATERLALTQVVMANSITSLRAIASIDWRTLVESQSVVETVLRGLEVSEETLVQMDSLVPDG